MSRVTLHALVERGARFAVTCHRRPDADALGSALGWAAILRALGKEAEVYSADPMPRTMRFLESPELPSEPPAGRFDACFVMDAAARALVPPLPPGLDGPVVMIDHHSAHDDYGDLVVREPDACATALVVLRTLAGFGLDEVPTDAVRPLYAALVADTGGFRYPGTSPETHRWAAALLEGGAEPWTTAYHLFEGWRPERMSLLGAVLEGLETHEDGKVALLTVTRAMLAHTGANEEMVEGMVNYGRMLEGVEVAALLWELASDRVETKVSLRASGGVDVSAVAKAMGGGGHRAAAGANVLADMASTRERVLGLVRSALEEA